MQEGEDAVSNLSYPLAGRVQSQVVWDHLLISLGDVFGSVALLWVCSQCCTVEGSREENRLPVLDKRRLVLII